MAVKLDGKDKRQLRNSKISQATNEHEFSKMSAVKKTNGESASKF
jgi:hypothetical protein